MRAKRSEVERAVTVLLRNLAPEKWQRPDGWADTLPHEAREDILTVVRAVESLRHERDRVRADLNLTRADLRRSVDRATRARQRLIKTEHERDGVVNAFRRVTLERPHGLEETR